MISLNFRLTNPIHDKIYSIVHLSNFSQPFIHIILMLRESVNLINDHPKSLSNVDVVSCQKISYNIFYANILIFNNISGHAIHIITQFELKFPHSTHNHNKSCART